MTGVTVIFIVYLHISELNVILAFKEIIDVGYVSAALADFESHDLLIVVLEDYARIAHNVSIAIAGRIQGLAIPD